MQIIPIKDLKDTAKISKQCENSSEPIYITKNGYGAMVLMNMEVFENFNKYKVASLINESLYEVESGAKPVDGDVMFERMLSKYE